MANMKNSKKKKIRRYPKRSSEVPVTQAMLFGVRDELIALVKSEIHGVKSENHGVRSEIQGVKSEVHGMKSEFHEVKSEIHEVKSEVHGLKSEIHEVKSEVHGLKSEIHEVKSEVHGLKSEVHRLGILIEEQNARNRIVLDGLTGLFARQDRVETDMAELKSVIYRSK